MELCTKNIYLDPADFPASSDEESVQKAVDEALSSGLKVVVLKKKADGTPYRFEHSVRIDSFLTVILDGCTIEAKAPAFINSHAYDLTTKSLHGEQHHFYLIGRNGATIQAERGIPGIYLSNVRDFRLENLTFAGGEGLKLHFARIGRVQFLSFKATEYGIQLSEGCNGLLVTDLCGETEKELLRFTGAETRLYGRDPDIRKSIYRRLCAKTNGAPAITFAPATVPASYMIFRDLTDLTEADRPSIEICETAEEVRDLTIRGVRSKGGSSVLVRTQIDGLFVANVDGAVTCEKAPTRSYTDEKPEEIALPETAVEFAWDDFVTPNEYEGATDAERIEKALQDGAAKKKAVVIPRRNARTGECLWDVDRAMILPSDTTLLLLGCHLRQSDFIYDNLFRIEKGTKNVTVTGFGDAVLDGGKFNGLQEKNAHKYGFGRIEDNALILSEGCENVTFSHFNVLNSRWHGLYFRFAKNVTVSSLDFYNLSFYPDMGGVQIRSGCQNFIVRDLTGIYGDDVVAVSASAVDGKMDGCSADIENIDIETLKVDAARFYTTKVGCHDGRKVSNVRIDTVMDVSLAEQKKAPAAGVKLGFREGYAISPASPGDLHHIHVRDVYSRGYKCVEFANSVSDALVEDVHGFSGATVGCVTTGKPELHNVRIDAFFYRCDQGSAYMRGTATSIITDKKKYVGCGANLTFTGEVSISHLKAGKIGNGVLANSGALTITDFTADEIGKIMLKRGRDAAVTVDGVPFTEEQM